MPPSLLPLIVCAFCFHLLSLPLFRASLSVQTLTQPPQLPSAVASGTQASGSGVGFGSDLEGPRVPGRDGPYPAATSSLGQALGALGLPAQGSGRAALASVALGSEEPGEPPIAGHHPATPALGWLAELAAFDGAALGHGGSAQVTDGGRVPGGGFAAIAQGSATTSWRRAGIGVSWWYRWTRVVCRRAAACLQVAMAEARVRSIQLRLALMDARTRWGRWLEEQRRAAVAPDEVPVVVVDGRLAFLNTASTL